jgi:hypothetical protein
MIAIGVMALLGVLGQSSSAMRVGATVAPQCRIDVGAATTSDDRSPALRVTCGRRELRTLRVTRDEGRAIQPVAALESSLLRAGGEVVFVVPREIGAVASLTPSLPAAAPARQPVVVTLDF